MVTVSVVIPCYNQGIYLDEAVRSVLDQNYQNYEIIIVNDGSTDSHTNNKISSYHHEKIRVITTDNQGLPSARNNGISISRGKYILPLDADDKIGESYLEKAVYAFEHNEKIGIVYSEAEFFGETDGKWILPDYSADLILVHNMIFCSALFRKQLWQDVGGYNANMRYGLEDWDLWLSIIALGYDVYKIPQVLFFYRKKESSMLDDLYKDINKHLLMNMQIIFNHQSMYYDNLQKLYLLLKRTIDETEGLGILSALYVDIGQDFNQDLTIPHISSLDQNSKFKTFFDTSVFKGIKGLCFYPVKGQACVLKLKQINFIQNDTGKTLNFNDIKGLIKYNGTMNAAGEIFFFTTVPQIYLPVSGEIDHLSIEGELRLLSPDQVIASIHNSFSWKLGRMITWLPRMILKIIMRRQIKGESNCCD